MSDQFRLKEIQRSGGCSYMPQIKKSGWFYRWRTLIPERMFPEIERIDIDPYDVFCYDKETALRIIDVYKKEQEEKKILKVEFINVTS